MQTQTSTQVSIVQVCVRQLLTVSDDADACGSNYMRLLAVWQVLLGLVDSFSESMLMLDSLAESKLVNCRVASMWCIQSNTMRLQFWELQLSWCEPRNTCYGSILNSLPRRCCGGWRLMWYQVEHFLPNMPLCSHITRNLQALHKHSVLSLVVSDFWASRVGCGVVVLVEN